MLDMLSAEKVKLYKNDRTIVNQKNFEYLLANPHIEFGGKKQARPKLLDRLKFTEVQS